MTEEPMKKCTKCGKEEPRKVMVVMKVAFHRLVTPSIQLKSRTPHWLCPECCGASDEWNIPKRQKVKTSGVNVPCDGCAGLFYREGITVSKVIFHPLGMPARTMRSRTLGWWCDPCRDKDQFWLLQEYASSPGYRETEQVGDNN